MNVNRFLIVINAGGVFALSALCVAQWRTNARLNLEVIAREKAQQEQAWKLAEAAKTINGYTADLENFRQQIIRTHARLKDKEDLLANAEQQVRQLTAEREALKAGLEKWQAAVASRDQRLDEANARVQQLAADRNDAVVKYNELAERYNTAVTNLNAAIARLKELRGTTPLDKEARRE